MPPKFIRPEDLEGLAQRFLAEHHASLEPPVPIEEIVEFALGLDIVPLPNLYRDFQIESWLSHDMQSIFVAGRREPTRGKARAGSQGEGAMTPSPPPSRAKPLYSTCL